MITDYNSTLNATDADEQFIMKVLEGTDKDEALLEKTSNLTRQSVNDKLSRYLLNMEHPVGGSKAKWFNKALGFTQDNMDDLAKQIVFNPKQAVQTGISEFGTKFNQTISINGANGKVIDVTFAWMKSVKDDVVRLVTAIPTKKITLLFRLEEKQMFNEYDVVRSKKNLSENVKLGTRGAIMLIYNSNPNKYEVEFIDANGETLDIITVDEKDLELEKK